MRGMEAEVRGHGLPGLDWQSLSAHFSARVTGPKCARYCSYILIRSHLRSHPVLALHASDRDKVRGHCP